MHLQIQQVQIATFEDTGILPARLTLKDLEAQIEPHVVLQFLVGHTGNFICPLLIIY